ncbi:N-acetyltransferase [Nakamurella silvestris]|nr:N-acetyltransferase [Nakamurella silvestris]
MVTKVVTPPTGEPLIGGTVRLDPSVESDAPGLFAALDDPRVYTSGFGGGPAGRPGSAEHWARSIRSSAAATDRMSYTVRLVADSDLGAAGQIIGTSSLGDILLEHGLVHLGWTGYSPAVWGTSVNAECKYLLLRHAFEDCGFGRVKIQTDSINERSQRAIAKLGATREGVLRRHRVRADGTFRDTVVFSILDTEWPRVRDGLLERLGRTG